MITIPIVPSKYLQCVGDQSMFMILPQGLENSEKYRGIYANYSKKAYTILDNGAAEGLAASNKQLIGLIDEFDFINEVIAPDVLGDPKATYKASQTFLVELGKACDDEVSIDSNKHKVRIMFVAHGHSIEEYIESVENLIALGMQTNRDFGICIPKKAVVDCNDVDARYNILAGSSLVTFTHKHLPVHFLGCHDLEELKNLLRNKPEHRMRIRSVDSSMPWYYTSCGKYMFTDPFPEREHNVTTEELTADPVEGEVLDTELMFRNLAVWKGYGYVN